MKYFAGTIIQAHDRQYIVAPNGAWRVLNYEKAPAPVEEKRREDIPLEEPKLIPLIENDGVVID